MNAESIVIRTPSGLSGDMLVTGLSRLADVSDAELSALLAATGVPALAHAVQIRPHAVGGVSGWQAHVELPHEHAHRTQEEIVGLIRISALPADARELAERTFSILAEAEARVHDVAVSAVHFHEVGALDSILDICLAAALLTKLAPASLWCSPLPVCDGSIRCAHGLLASPAPAVLEMLTDVPVYGIDAEGETLTPTAVAFLKAAGAKFGKWPTCTVLRQARVYGGKLFHTVPNGALFFAVQEQTAAIPTAHAPQNGTHHGHTH